MSMRLWRIFEVLTRKKPIEDPSESKLAKVLSAFDLTALGIGSTLGVGVYVLAGQVARESAGPAVIISFIIAAIASVFAGLCYAEFGARVPKAGSAYIYSYVTIGEFIAFIIGWNLILEYAIGSASVVKGLSHYLDKLFDNAMRNYLNETIPMHIDGLAPYPDVFAFSATMLFSWAIAVGAKESTIVNNVFTGLNLCVVLFVIIAGLFKVDLKNWRIPESQVPDKKYGTGGFFPYGFSGIIRGAATCFYGFIGFDCIATAGEEAKNPRKSIPFAVITSLAMIFLAYFGISTVLTMMLPYYEQDKDAPLPHVFKIYGWYVAEKIVSVGATFGLCASLMGAMFPLPRIVFAMSSDGLLYKFMGEISTKYRTPFNGTLLTGLLTGILAAIFNLDQLVEMMSIGTLLAYSMVAGCVVILRYEFDEKTKHSKGHLLSENGTNRVHKKKDTTFIGKLLNTNHIKSPTKFSSKIVTISVSLFSLWCFFLSMSLVKFEDDINNVTFSDTVLAILASIPVIISLVIIHRQPVSNSELSFKVPFLPWLPGISIFINIYLMTRLDIKTWIRFIIWIVIGLVIYFSYGIRKSNERKRELARIASRNSETENDSKAEVPLIYVCNNSNSNSTTSF